MEIIKLMLIITLSVCKAEDWEITMNMEHVNNLRTRLSLSVTFYERSYNSSIPAPNVSMEIMASTASSTMSNISIPNIRRPTRIDVWVNGERQVTDHFLRKLTMKNLIHNFTFECNCILGTNECKATLFPTEDRWKIQVTTGYDEYSNSGSRFPIVIRDRAGVSQTSELYGPFERGSVTTLHRIVHLEDPVAYTMWSFERIDWWDCTGMTLIRMVTCTAFSFPCHGVKTNVITNTVNSIGTWPDCSTTDGFTTSIIRTCPTTTSTTTTATSTTTTTASILTTNSKTTTATIPPTTSATTTVSIPTTTSSTAAPASFPTTTSTTTAITIRTSSMTEVPSDTRQIIVPCCPCVPTKLSFNMTSPQIQKVVQELKSQLSVNKSSLSSSVRKKTCAQDSRPSSQVIGVAGVVFLAFPILTMVIFDCTRLCQHL